MLNPTVDFYLLNTLEHEDVYRFTCRLVDKAYLLQKRIYIKVNSHEQGQRLDELLWTFRDISFIPHCYLGINSGFDPINLSHEVPSYFPEFSRIIEVVSAEKGNKNHSRQKYKFYKTQNCQLTTHNISAT